jgi:broad specificity phosphatase PhoE
MTITLTREEAQQVLDALEDAADHIGCPDDDDAIGIARRTLRNRLAQPEWGEDYRAMYLKVRDELAELQQREWQGLTDEEAAEVERWVEFKEEGSGRIPTGKLIRYIEAKLKEKNT